MRGDTRKRTVIHCANTYPTLLFLLLLSPVVTIHSEQLKASALQTSGEPADESVMLPKILTIRSIFQSTEEISFRELSLLVWQSDL